MKDSLTATLTPTFGDGIEVIILSLSAGSLIVDYKVEVPAEVTLDESVKKTAIVTAPAVEIPTSSGQAITSTPIVQPFRSYAYVRTAGTCPTVECSTACGYQGLSVADVYACQEDGVNVAEDSCASAGIGATPSSTTRCCPAADEETCSQSAAEVSAHTIYPRLSLDAVSASVPNISDEDQVQQSGSAFAIVLVVLVVLVAICGCRKFWRTKEDAASTKRPQLRSNKRTQSASPEVDIDAMERGQAKGPDVLANGVAYHSNRTTGQDTEEVGVPAPDATKFSATRRVETTKICKSRQGSRTHGSVGSSSPVAEAVPKSKSKHRHYH
jgi:hypothetical protein